MAALVRFEKSRAYLNTETAKVSKFEKHVEIGVPKNVRMICARLAQSVYNVLYKTMAHLFCNTYHYALAAIFDETCTPERLSLNFPHCFTSKMGANDVMRNPSIVYVPP